jgi:hypothetical protein
MADLEEQRRKVEELKKKILEQKTKGTVASVVQEEQQSTPVVAAKIISPDQIGSPQKEEANIPTENISQSVKHETPLQSVKEKNNERHNAASGQQHATAVIALQAYAQALKQAWSDGDVSKDEETILFTLRRTLGISDEEHKNLERELQVDIYLHALTVAWRGGGMSAKDSERLEYFRNKFHISSDEHFRLEKQVREDVLRAK